MIPLVDTQPLIGASPCEGRPDSSVRSLIHDLRQPLSVIETCAYCLRMMLKSEDPQILEQLDCIQDQILEAGLILVTASQPQECRETARAALA